MLKTRVLTAIVILPVVLGLAFAGSDRAWTIFALVLALLAGWEWSRLCGFGPVAMLAYQALGAAVGLGLAGLWQFDPARFSPVSQAGYVIATYFWIFAVPLWLRMKLRPSPWVLGLAGWIVIWPLWAALVELRAASPWVLLAITAIVWIADVAAYFAGRRFGKRKLAPAISPGKTWEGVAGALAAVLAYGILLDVLAYSRVTILSPFFGAYGGALAVLAMLALVALSVLGDLFESWMKRGAGRKDSSSLLPGHGGVLDRVDALTSTLPVAALLVSFV
ncbi:MAG: phosphatidate cytidylyltransferase [Betaproteobacteria bacterium]|nr:phosphatidate cytidylyltransferase [Betaproteobacteria bacterium]